MKPASVRHAIITGGSSGIGLALAQQLADKGASLTIIGRDQRRLRSACRQLSPHCNKLLGLSADVTDPTAIRAAIDDAIRRLGTSDLLITSAGIATPGHFMDLAMDEFQRAMDTNYFGTLNAVRAVMPTMTAARGGRVIMIASGAALVGVYGYSAYAPSKYAVRGLAEVLRAELKPIGIGVSIAYPPDTYTPQYDQENLHKPAETRAISGKVAPWSPTAVAKVILKGAGRQRFVIAPGWQMEFLVRWHSLLNPLLQYYVDKLIATARRTNNREPI